LEPQLVLHYKPNLKKQQQRRRKRRNRWADAPEAPAATKKQRSRSRWSVVTAADAAKTELIALQLRISDVQMKLAKPNCGVNEGDSLFVSSQAAAASIIGRISCELTMRLQLSGKE